MIWNTTVSSNMVCNPAYQLCDNNHCHIRLFMLEYTHNKERKREINA